MFLFTLKTTICFLSEIWDALRAAAEADLSLAQTIVDSAGIIVSNSDMTLCYDERGKKYVHLMLFLLHRPCFQNQNQCLGNSAAGAKYELPKYVLSEPANLTREK